METVKNITALDIARNEHPHGAQGNEHPHGAQALLPAIADPYRIEDPRDEIVRRLEAAWQRVIDELFAERLAA